MVIMEVMKKVFFQVLIHIIKVALIIDKINKEIKRWIKIFSTVIKKFRIKLTFLY
ncbi:hypothetical protein RhiirC2_733879 [Rhizophagus irregularis]|uniref:Uncharacterized protein n=1 Tax=Rhizophagus irregularis TaxID=588596 RepID=A0A2N1NRS0_9GLOM|nr:hypothetical protein RhiirC2_733879 [Rhizophagus irregularis]